MLTLSLQRSKPIGLALPGEITINGQHACWTLENNADRIPTGTYPITLYDSPHFGRKMPLLLVPGRSYIEIHFGSYPQDYRGCIGVGKVRDEATGDIFSTQAMFQELYPAIEGAVDGGEGCQITIYDPPEGPQTFLNGDD
jgi:hypothetical protein